MTLDDAKGVLTGGDTAATDFFRKKTETQLTGFLPIVKGTTDKVGLAQMYNTYAGAAARFGAIKSDQAQHRDLRHQAGPDRLYKVIAEKEKAFRANPNPAAS